MEPQDQSQEMEITLIRRTKSIAEDPAAGQRKRDRESGRLKAQEHAPEMLMMIVGIARDSGEDTKNRFAAAKYVCDRAWGTPKAEQNEDPAITNKTMLDILASVSRECFEAEEAARKQIATQSRLTEPRQNPIIEASYMEVPNDEET